MNPLLRYDLLPPALVAKLCDLELKGLERDHLDAKLRFDGKTSPHVHVEILVMREMREVAKRGEKVDHMAIKARRKTAAEIPTLPPLAYEHVTVDEVAKAAEKKLEQFAANRHKSDRLRVDTPDPPGLAAHLEQIQAAKQKHVVADVVRAAKK